MQQTRFHCYCRDAKSDFAFSTIHRDFLIRNLQPLFHLTTYHFFLYLSHLSYLTTYDFYPKTYASDMPLRYRNPKPKRPCEKHKLPWGYDAPSKKTTPLKDFITYITDGTIKPAEEGRTNSVLVYWDRGTISSGDEAKMVELGIDS